MYSWKWIVYTSSKTVFTNQKMSINQVRKNNVQYEYANLNTKIK